MRKLTTILFLFLLNASIGLAQTSSIYGRVVNSKDTTLTRWATVVLTQNDSIIQVTHTSENGRYSFHYLDSGNYEVKATYLNTKSTENNAIFLGAKEKFSHIKYLNFEGTIWEPIYVTKRNIKRTITTGCPGSRPGCGFTMRGKVITTLLPISKQPSFDLATLTKVINEKPGIIETTQSSENYDGMGVNLLWSNEYFSGGGISQGQPVDLFIE